MTKINTLSNGIWNNRTLLARWNTLAFSYTPPTASVSASLYYGTFNRVEIGVSCSGGDATEFTAGVVLSAATSNPTIGNGSSFTFFTNTRGSSSSNTLMYFEGSTTYYYRSWVTSGGSTVYGTVQSFTTYAGVTLTIYGHTVVNSTTVNITLYANGNGNALSNGYQGYTLCVLFDNTVGGAQSAWSSVEGAVYTQQFGGMISGHNYQVNYIAYVGGQEFAQYYYFTW